MEKFKHIIIYTAGLLMLASCANDDDANNASTANEPIAIAAAISENKAVTRAAYTLTTPTTENALNAEVWVSTTSHSYPGNQIAISETATSIDYHNTATFTGGSKQLMNTQMYYVADPNTTPVYLVGLYPTGWTVSSDGGTSNAASYTFTGKEDVMYAPEVHNSLSTSSSYPVLQFGHLLTHLRIFAYADGEETANTWGKITSVSIASTNTVTVKTDDATSTFTNSTGATGSISAFVTDTDTPFTGQTQELGLTSEEIAYVLCAPCDAKSTEGVNEYTLTLTFDNNKKVSVSVNLKGSGGSNFDGNTAGHQFDVTLKFIKGNAITTSATVTDWESQGASITPVSD